MAQHEKKENVSIGRQIVEFCVMVLLIFGCYIGLREFVVGTYEIPSGSMENTIMVGDRVFSERISYYTRAPEPGEIVTFEDPQKEGQTLIKRCIATEGQTVDLIDGYVYVDGVQLDEPYTNGKPSNPLDTVEGVTIEYPYTIPEGCLWVMGDNRTNSADSRHFGAIPVSSVTGHANFVYWPLDQIGPLE